MNIYRRCKVCNIEFVPPSKSKVKKCAECIGSRLCYTCGDKIPQSRGKFCLNCLVKTSRRKYTDENIDDWVECSICGYRGPYLGTHLKNHKEVIEYVGERTAKNCKLRWVGENNPGWKHGGKMSPYSKNNPNINESDIAISLSKMAKTRKENNNVTTSLEYWIKIANGNVDEAKKLLNKRQTTFSLDKCIEKYGDELGQIKWQERQDKWQDTIQSKPKEELDLLNSKKSCKVNYNSLWNSELTDDGIFYILELQNRTIKIGVSTRDLQERYKRKDLETCKILHIISDNIDICFKIEQLTVKHFKKLRIEKNEEIAPFGWTETFRCESTKIIEYVNELLESNTITEQFNVAFRSDK